MRVCLRLRWWGRVISTHEWMEMTWAVSMEAVQITSCCIFNPDTCGREVKVGCHGNSSYGCFAEAPLSTHPLHSFSSGCRSHPAFTVLVICCYWLYRIHFEAISNKGFIHSFIHFPRHGLFSVAANLESISAAHQRAQYVQSVTDKTRWSLKPFGIVSKMMMSSLWVEVHQVNDLCRGPTQPHTLPGFWKCINALCIIKQGWAFSTHCWNMTRRCRTPVCAWW